eukprot:gnl/Trimastix_PCT/3841.p1 GENE.gnl/Trimastix_PCT/3841~~gnl/Trimastix_PCT/3841.p1  ORF type:complete len:434 (-),score=105.07 gnl/Trimastix_PCT/3841:60-1340(-)
MAAIVRFVRDPRDPQSSLDYPRGVIPPLTEICASAIGDSFARSPTFEGIPEWALPIVIRHIPLTLDLSIAAPVIEDEGYWRRRCEKRWTVNLHEVSSWKRYFFQRYVEEAIEAFGTPRRPKQSISEIDYERWSRQNKGAPIDDDTDTIDPMDPVLLQQLLHTAAPFVERLVLHQVLSHLDLQSLLSTLGNLRNLALSYGARNVGTEFRSDLVGIRASDCRALSESLRACNLTKLAVTESLLSDKQVRAIVKGLLENHTVAHLDFSHNTLSAAGLKTVCHLLHPARQPIITHLNLCHNQIRSDAGTLLRDLLTHNRSLTHLSLRLNHIATEGAIDLASGLARNETLLELNLSSNGIATQAAAPICDALREHPRLRAVDLSCNLFGSGAGDLFLSLLHDNAQIFIDVRLCDLGQKIEERVAKMCVGRH